MINAICRQFIVDFNVRYQYTDCAQKLGQILIVLLVINCLFKLKKTHSIHLEKSHSESFLYVIGRLVQRLKLLLAIEVLKHLGCGFLPQRKDSYFRLSGD